VATLSVQEIDQDGLEATFAAVAGGGDQFLNSGKEFIEIVNDDASDKTLTIVSQITISGLAVSDQTVVVTAGERRHVGPFATGTFNDSSGYVQLTYSAATSVTIAVLRVKGL
jgi:hypothetical protein